MCAHVSVCACVWRGENTLDILMREKVTPFRKRIGITSVPNQLGLVLF